MNRRTSETELAEADRRVALGRREIAAHWDLIGELQPGSADFVIAGEILGQMRALQAQRMTERDRLAHLLRADAVSL